MFRHAERLSSGQTNPPLSARGLEQARQIAEDLSLGLFPAPTKIFSSPKIRAQQTFLPLSQQSGLELQVHLDLDERQSNESASKFDRRVQNFLKHLEKQNGVVYLVTHLDWIETALQLIPSDAIFNSSGMLSWAPAQSAEFELQEQFWLFLKLRTSSK
jgi:broad specificity phosphatase PhoE